MFAVSEAIKENRRKNHHEINKVSVPAVITIGQALRWLAYGFVPLPLTLERQMPDDPIFSDFQHSIGRYRSEFSGSKNDDEPEEKILEYLQSGKLHARGTPDDPNDKCYGEGWIAPTEKIDLALPENFIPPSFWKSPACKIKWMESYAQVTDNDKYYWCQHVGSTSNWPQVRAQEYLKEFESKNGHRAYRKISVRRDDVAGLFGLEQQVKNHDFGKASANSNDPAERLTAPPCVLADYDFWFAKDLWTLQEVGALVAGLNPEIVWHPETATAYKNYNPDDQISYQLWRYTEETGHWDKILAETFDIFVQNYCASELDALVDKQANADKAYDFVTVKPMEIIQWAIDDNVPMHYRLVEYLQSKEYRFRFSQHSDILNVLKIEAKKDIWEMPRAARLVLGLHPESPKMRLENRQNLYRHLDPNYTLTQRDEVYQVMELALQSWQTKNLEFFEVQADISDYYNDENCGVSVEAKKFIAWAIQKGFKPPEQLLELMGLREPVTKRENKMQPLPEDQGYSTPYLELMKKAIRELKITSQNQPTKKVLVAWLLEQDSSLSQNDAGALATFIRLPEMKKGGWNKRNGDTQKDK